MKLSRRHSPDEWDTSCLGRDERILSWGVSTEGVTIVATNHALWLSDSDSDSPGAGEPADHSATRSVPWHLIAKATWRDSWLAITEVDVVDDLWLVDRQPVRIRLTESRDLPEKVKQRVEHSVVRSEIATVDGGSVRFVARKIAGKDGLHWWARLEGGVMQTPEIEAAVAARVARLRGQRD